MKTSAPTQAVFIIALILGILGILGFVGVLAPVAAYAFWLVAGGWFLLVLGCLLRGI